MKILKSREFWLRILSIILFAVMSYMGIRFCNAGHAYEQDVPFRIFCVCFALLVLIHLPLKDTLTIWSLLYLPICYVVTHVGYEKHWIADNCDYQFVDLIRWGKLVVLFWGLMLLALIRHIVREDLLRRLAEMLRGCSRFKKLILFGWALYAVLLTIANPGYAYVIVFTMGFPAFFLICREKRQRRNLLQSYLDGVLLCFLWVSLRAMLHRPYDTERYLFYFSNENMAGMYLSTIAIAVAVRLDGAWHMAKGKLRSIKLVFLHALAVWTGVLVLFNYTRTYLLGMGFSFGMYFILRMIRSRHKKRFFLRFALPFLLILLCAYPGYLAIRYLPAVSGDPVYFTGEEGNETRVQPGDPIDSPRYTSIQRYLTLSFGKWGIDLHLEGEEDYAESSEEGELVTLHEDRDVSNGRMRVWGLFLERMTWKGHYPGHIVVDEDWLIYHAHNTYFQNMFQYGIPVGLLFGVMMLLSYAYAAWRTLKTKHQYTELRFSLLALGNVMVGMLTEWSGHPVYPFGMFLMFALCGLIHEREL